MRKPAAWFDFFLEHILLRLCPRENAAHLDNHRKLVRRRSFDLPLNIETDTRDLVRMRAQSRLVRITIIEAGGKRMPALKIHQMRENFDHTPGRRLSSHAPGEQHYCD